MAAQMMSTARSTSWMNMSEGWRRATLVAIRRGPTQQEAQAAKADRERRKVAAGDNLSARAAINEEAQRWNQKAGERREIA